MALAHRIYECPLMLWKEPDEFSDDNLGTKWRDEAIERICLPTTTFPFGMRISTVVNNGPLINFYTVLPAGGGPEQRDPVGFSIYKWRDDTEEYHLYALEVFEEYRGLGYGRSIVKSIGERTVPINIPSRLFPFWYKTVGYLPHTSTQKKNDSLCREIALVRQADRVAKGSGVLTLVGLVKTDMGASEGALWLRSQTHGCASGTDACTWVGVLLLRSRLGRGSPAYYRRGV